MYIKLDGFLKTSNFAKQYKGRTYNTSKTGVHRLRIHQLGKEEELNPNTTGIDVIEIDGVRFFRATPVTKGKTKSKSSLKTVVSKLKESLKPSQD